MPLDPGDSRYTIHPYFPALISPGSCTLAWTCDTARNTADHDDTFTLVGTGSMAIGRNQATGYDFILPVP